MWKISSTLFFMIFVLVNKMVWIVDPEIAPLRRLDVSRETQKREKAERAVQKLFHVKRVRVKQPPLFCREASVDE